MHRCLHRQLGGTFWRAGHCHNRQRHPIHLCSLDQDLHTAGHQACAHHCLPPSKQRMVERVKWCTVRSKMLYVHVLTIACHPQSNGMVERVHRQIKNALGACAYHCLPPSKQRDGRGCALSDQRCFTCMCSPLPTTLKAMGW